MSSIKRGNGQQPVQGKLRRRSSSLTDMTEAAVPIPALKEVKKREKDGVARRGSSPDLNVVDSPSKDAKVVGLADDNSAKVEEERGKEDQQQQSEETKEDNGKKETSLEGVLAADSSNIDRMSVSTSGSAVSAVSGDDVETVIDDEEDINEGEVTPQGSRKSRGPLQSSDLEGGTDQDDVQVEGSVEEKEQLSASCSTLENDKQDTTRENSVEPPRRRHQMSVSFRQELLSVCQLKTDPKLDGEVTKLASPSLDVVQMLGRTLPHIVPHMIHNKREVSYM